MKTPDKLEAGMMFASVGGSGLLYFIAKRMDGEKLCAVYLNSTPKISATSGGLKDDLDVESFVRGDKYLGKIDCAQLKLKLKELINDEET